MNERDLRKARGVLPFDKHDPVMKNPDAVGNFVFVTLRADADQPTVRHWFEVVDSAISDLRAQQREGKRVATVATGFAPAFFSTGGAPRFPDLSLAPAGLTAPPSVAGSTPVVGDVVFYVLSVSEGVTARFLTAISGDPVAALSLERGYQRLDGTEPFGFRDGVRNVARSERLDVVLVDRGQQPEEPWWAHDGTYLAYLKIAQNTTQMGTFSPAEQDAVIGRTREGHRLDDPSPKGKPNPASEGPYTGEPPEVDSHVRKVGPRGATHDTVQIFRRGLPFYEVGSDATLRVGLQFASFQATLDAFDVVLNRWMANPSFPVGGPGRRDQLLERNLITIEKHGYFFVPPDTDLPVGDVMFAPGPKSKVPKTGKVAVRKKLLDAAGQPHPGELAGFAFAVTTVDGNAVGGTFETDGKGHALSDELPVDTDLRLVEVAVPAGFSAAAPQDFKLHSSREVLSVVNTVPSGTVY
jgi:Dyp-type peroxidase family